MKKHSYKLMLFSMILIAGMVSSCAKKVVIESDHRHPHIHHRHPHERPVQQTNINIR
ncbi:MAG: hypothetical protein JWO03_649 [Bacteroidetes bacterium]|nr:hypothetical protein [Bacteroidota bacterium]